MAPPELPALKFRVKMQFVKEGEEADSLIAPP